MARRCVSLAGVTDISLRTAPAPAAFRAADAKLPSRIKLLNWGWNDTSEGPVIVDEVTARLFAANQKAIGRERVAVDFEHNTVPGSREYDRTQEPRAVAGHCALVCVPGEGIFGEALTYTAAGQTHAADYEDVSIAPYLDKEGRVVAAHSVALTHTGAAYGLTFEQARALSAGDIASHFKILSASCDAVVREQTQKPMSEKFLSVAALATLVGLSASAEEQDVMAKLKDRLAAPAVDLTPLSALVKDGKIIVLDQVAAMDGRLKTLEQAGTKGVATLSAEIDGKVITLSAQDIVNLSDKLTKLEAQVKNGIQATLDNERSRLVTLFASDGKVPKNADGKPYTAEELKALDLPTLKLLHANTPVTVPLSARTRGASGEQAVDANLKGHDRMTAAFSKQIRN